ncbi:MAG TPA: succinate dehydrogenase, hydrophobic membrane anchor protein [Alphaproteobacteria bacterium]|nr:succinate dehydrogenase, hydrophobic membrane anchor protein [Alphaproteobacteria bacterium]
MQHEAHSLRTTLGRVRGLGSAKEGVHHWYAERWTSIALIPLNLWFIAAVIGHIGASHAEFIAWLSRPFPAVMMILNVALIMYHTALGLQVVLEDYVHNELLKTLSILAVKGACLALAVAGIFAVAKISFGA